MTTSRNNHNDNNNSSSSSSSSIKKNMRRRTIQAIAAAALVVSAQAFSLPASQVNSMRHNSLASSSSPHYVNSRTTVASSALSMMDQEEKQEFDLQLGRVLDALKTDYPKILKQSPDFSVYDPNLMVVDPSGFTLNGIRNYKQAFHLVHGIVNVFYCPEKSLLTFRMVYDCARNNIRVSWNAEVVPKAIFGGDRSMLHVDGISVYELNSAGKVRQHRVEHLMINDQPVETERGIFHALRNECQDADCIPAFVKAAASSSDDHFIARFQTAATPGTKSLFHVASTTTTTAVQALSTSSASNNSESGGDLAGLDRDALDRKNKTRKKFGLKALTPEEFMEIEAQVQQMGVDETIKQNQQAASNDAAEMPQQESKKKGGFLNNIFGQVFEDTCESNFDCKRPEICCDFGFKKQCCSSGAMVGNEMMPVRIPVTKDDGYMNGW